MIRPGSVLLRLREELVCLVFRELDGLLTDREVKRRLVHQRDVVERLRTLARVASRPVLTKRVPHLRRRKRGVAVRRMRRAPDDLALAAGFEARRLYQRDLTTTFKTIGGKIMRWTVHTLMFHAGSNSAASDSVRPSRAANAIHHQYARTFAPHARVSTYRTSMLSRILGQAPR